MSLLLRQWRALFVIYFQEGLAYRASGLIWILNDLSMGITAPLVWIKAQEISGPIAGYDASGFVMYYLCMLIISCFVTSHMMWEIATEIKDGQFTSHLLKPVSYFQLSFIRNITWRMIRPMLFLPFFIMFLYLYRSYLTDTHVFLGWQFWISLFLGHLVSFTFVMMMSMIAFFTQEVMSIFEIYYVPMLFLSGGLFPISMMPEWAVRLSKVFPFYYTVGAPTEIVIGRTPESQMFTILMIQGIWALASYLLAKVLWHHGLRRYAAVGM